MRRLARLCTPAIVFLVSCSTPQTLQTLSPQFQREHAQGLQRTPFGVELTLATVDGQTTYHFADKVELLLSFTSETEGYYTVETLTGMSAAGSSDDLVIQAPGLAAPIHSQSRLVYSVKCCDSRRRSLGRTRLTTTTTFSFDWLRQAEVGPSGKLQPGDYVVFVQTKRVMRGWPRPNVNRYAVLDGTVVTSNLLHIKLLPDDVEQVKHPQPAGPK